MPAHPISPLSALATVIRKRELIVQLAQREIAARFRGSFAGLLWNFATPVCTLAMYTFVFGVVFKSSWGLSAEGRLDFALILFAGLAIHGMVAECLNRAPGLIIGNTNFVKQIVFPLEILPVVSLCVAIFNTSMSMLLLLLAWALLHGGLHVQILFLPLMLLPLAVMSLGFAWFLSALTVYIRDIAHGVVFVSSALLFMSPIFYKTKAVPEQFVFLLHFNPLTFIIESVRGMLIEGNLPDASMYLQYWCAAAITAALGYAWFQKTRSGFADVL